MEHLTMTWPYSVIGAGGCTDPRWVASFTKVSFVNQSATGDPRKKKKAFQTMLVSLESPFSPETQDLTCTDSHHSEKYSGRVELLRSWAWKLCNIRTYPLRYLWSVAQSSSNQCTFSLFHGSKMCPADYTKKRLSHRRLYSTFVTSCENKAI